MQQASVCFLKSSRSEMEFVQTLFYCTHIIFLINGSSIKASIKFARFPLVIVKSQSRCRAAPRKLCHLFWKLEQQCKQERVCHSSLAHHSQLHFERPGYTNVKQLELLCQSGMMVHLLNLVFHSGCEMVVHGFTDLYVHLTQALSHFLWIHPALFIGLNDNCGGETFLYTASSS